MTKDKFISTWNELDDEMRLRWLIKTKDNQNIPEYIIRVDNDSVFLEFIEDNEEDPEWVEFNEFGYHMLPTLFKAVGLKSDFV